ncbi:hypothetical protein C8R46DRAFT_1191910 [Mycena filopes]|nr:hypothetical protein C8R46DRAFT_1191910 [Mycena filopes]
MPANCAPLMRRSAPAKKRSTKRSATQPKPADYVPADACLGEERDLRRFALKRSSLEKALTSSKDALYSPQPLPDLSVPQFTTVDYTAVSAAPASPSVSPCSTPRPSLTRTSSTALPPTSTASLSTTPPKRPSMDRSASIYNFPNTLAQLEVPGSCSTRLMRASVDSTTSSGSGSRRSSVASDASTPSVEKPRLRAFPRFFVLVAQTTYTTLKHHLVPAPTPEQQLTIPPVPMMRDGAPRPRRSSLISKPKLPKPAAGFEALAPGEKRIRFVCPQRVSPMGMALWPELSTALSAAKGSVEDLKAVSVPLFFRRPPATEPTIIWLLPVYYIHLDPSKIPTPDAVDKLVSTSTRLPAIDAACTSLRALCDFVDLSVFPFDAAPDLWERSWPWMQFLHEYWDYLPKFDRETEIHACVRHACVLAKLRGHIRTRDLIARQRGVRFIFARAWAAILLDGVDVIQGSAVFNRSARLLPTLADGLHTPANFEEVLDGVGGTMDRLASAFMKQISVALGGSEMMNVVSLGTAVAALISPPDTKAWVAVLLSHRVIKWTVKILRAFDDPHMHTRVPEMGRINLPIHTQNNCWDLLLRCVTSSPGYPWLAEAIEAGFLHCIITSAGKNEHTEHTESFLTTILPLGLVSPSVLKRMKTALVGVENLASRPAFTRSPSFGLWKDIVAVTKTRIEILDAWEAAGRPSSMACDNMRCGRVEAKAEFKACAGCRCANYCSPECQALDWKDGHRGVCDSLRAARHLYPESVHPRERSFMHTLTHHDYQRFLFKISVEQVWFMRDHPGADFIVVFDYTKPTGVEFKLDPRARLPENKDLEVELPVQWERCARSGGRMGLHVMFVGEACEVRARLFPLRASSAVFQFGLKALARSTMFRPDSDDEQIHDKLGVAALIEKTRGRFTEIH